MATTRAILGLCLGLIFFPGALLARDEPCPQDLACTDDFTVLYEEALALGRRHGPENVLLVFDIDNTLLAMDQALGSDQWFVWQWGLLKTTPLPDAAVAEDKEGLLRTQRLLFALSHMHPPQPSQPALLAELQNRGFPVIALTSRGYLVRDVTRRELARNGYDLARNAVPPRPGFHDDPFLPYNPGDLSSAGLSAEEASAFSLGRPRLVSYRNGLYMTAGQHKGAMLRVLLNRTCSRFKAIAFLDDHARNVRAMRDAFPPDSGIELTTYRFTREAANVAAFQAPAAKERVSARWDRLEEVIVDVFPSRATGFYPLTGVREDRCSRQHNSLAAGAGCLEAR